MTIKRVGIVGSGIMGSGIAEVAAKAGAEVVLRSRQQATADAMVAALEKSLTKQVDRGKLEQAEATAILGRVTGLPTPGEAWTVPGGRLETGAVLNIGNNYSDVTCGRDRLILDSEIYELTFAAKYGITDRARLSASLNWVLSTPVKVWNGFCARA